MLSLSRLFTSACKMFFLSSIYTLLMLLPHSIDTIDSPSPIDYEKNIVAADQTKLLEPFSYYRALGGKGRRELMLYSLNYHLKLPSKWVQGVAAVIEDLHNASLLLDDIEDNSPLRRGRAAAHIKYGVPSTINSANYVFFIVLAKIDKLAGDFGANGSKMSRIYGEEMLELHRGQGLELWWRDNAVCPTVDEYVVMAERKTGGLMRLGARLLMSHPSCEMNSALVDIVTGLGLLYQIRDDYINLVSTNFHDKKGFAEDLNEGKFSFPIIHSLGVNPNTGLLDIIRQKPEDVETKKLAIEMIRGTGSLDYTRDCLRKREADLRQAIAAIGGSPGLEKFVSQLSVDNKVVE